MTKKALYKNVKCANCKTEQAVAKGLCQKCYIKERRKQKKLLVKQGVCNACGAYDYLRRGWCLNCYRWITGLSQKKKEQKPYSPNVKELKIDTSSIKDKIYVFVKINENMELKVDMPIQLNLSELKQLVKVLEQLEVSKW